MAQSQIVREYIGKVCGQVKAKRAHGLIGNELIEHIEEQTLAYMEMGMKESAAEERAIEDMGDPITVGEQFNQIHRSKIIYFDVIGNIIIWAITIGILALGVFFGIGLLLSIFISGSRVIGIIAGGGIIAFSIIMAISFFALCKFIANELFYYSLLKDYKRRKKRGQLYDYKKNY